MSIFQCEKPSHPLYVKIIHGKNTTEAAWRQHLEELWQKYQPYAGADFLNQIGIDFYSKLWEMRLAVEFINMGLTLLPSPVPSPSICFQLNDSQKVWVQPIIPQLSTLNNFHNQDLEARTEQAMQYYVTFLQEQYSQCYQQAIQSGVIAPNDCFILAVNDTLDCPQRTDGFPDIVKAVYAVGEQQYSYDPVTQKATYAGYNYRPYLRKKSGDRLRFDAFIDGIYPGLTGLILSIFPLSSPVDIHNNEAYSYVSNMTAWHKKPKTLFSNWLHYELGANGQLQASYLTHFQE